MSLLFVQSTLISFAADHKLQTHKSGSEKSFYTDAKLGNSFILEQEQKTLSVEKSDNLPSGNFFSAFAAENSISILSRNKIALSYSFNELKADFLSPVNIIFPFHYFW